jgi:glycopeptide antibiotics resistance protein
MFKKAIYKNSWLNLIVFILSMMYLLIMIKLLFVRGRIGSESYMYNLIPFKTIKSYMLHRDYYPFRIWFNNLLGNIVLFIPIGLILPFLNRIFLRPLLFIVTTVLIIFAVELIQMITKQGSFDVDDMILNTFGACIGLVLTILTVRSVLQLRKLGG